MTPGDVEIALGGCSHGHNVPNGCDKRRDQFRRRTLSAKSRAGSDMRPAGVRSMVWTSVSMDSHRSSQCCLAVGPSGAGWALAIPGRSTGQHRSIRLAGPRGYAGQAHSADHCRGSGRQSRRSGHHFCGFTSGSAGSRRTGGQVGRRGGDLDGRPDAGG